MGLQVTEGLGAGSKPEVGKAAAEEALEEIRDHLAGAHMVFVTAGMGGGTGTGAAPVIARAARELGILTVGVVTKPFHFEGGRRMKVAETGIADLQKAVDTLIIIPNQNLFRVANEKTTFADAFAMADQVLYSGVACITDLMVKEGLINLDFADVRSIMSEMGKAMMGTGEAAGDKRAVLAAEAAIANPLLDETSMRGARGLLISITGGNDLTLYEVDEAASRIRQEVDEEANIILGATFDSALDGVVRVSVVATGIDLAAIAQIEPANVQSRPEPIARPRLFAPLRSAHQAHAQADAPAAAASPSAVHDGDAQSSAATSAAFPEPIEPRPRSGRFGAGSIHSARGGRARGPRGPHAADRGPAAGGAESVARQARSSGRRSPRRKRAAGPCWRNSPRSASRATRRSPRRRRRRPPRPRRRSCRFSGHTPVTPVQTDLGRPQPRQQPPRRRPALSTRTAGPSPVLRFRRTIIWISRRSCAATRTDSARPRALEARGRSAPQSALNLTLKNTENHR